MSSVPAETGNFTSGKWASARRSSLWAVRCGLIRRSARVRSKLKVEILRDSAFAADELRAEVVFERNPRQRVLKQLGIGGDARLLLCSGYEFTTNAAANSAILAAKQSELSRGGNNRPPPQTGLAVQVANIGGWP